MQAADTQPVGKTNENLYAAQLLCTATKAAGLVRRRTYHGAS
jgi:hypothetical protein